MNPDVAAPTRRPGVRWSRLVLWAAAAGLLGLVFLMYTRPGFLVMLVDQLWSCF